MNKKTLNGFTLMEMIVVIAIIATILTISFVSFNDARQKARNSKRLSDITQIQNTLSLYLRDEGTYPESLDFGTQFIGSSSNKVYMLELPQNPTPNNDGICPDSEYHYEMADGNYRIDFCLSKPTGNLEAGEKCATPQGILNRSCFICGQDTVLYAGGPYDSSGTTRNQSGYYRTVQVGNDCWFKDNINAGTMITSSGNNQTDANSGTFEKYCYSDSSANCDNDGGLYQWHTALGLPQSCDGDITFTDNGNDTYTGNCGGADYTIVANQKGICPSGWHVATDGEWHLVEAFYSVPSGDTYCSPTRFSWGCATAADKMKIASACSLPGDPSCDLSGLSLPLAGLRASGGSFMSRGEGVYTLSTQPDSTGFTERYLHVSEDEISRSQTFRTSGNSVRCVKN